MTRITSTFFSLLLCLPVALFAQEHVCGLDIVSEDLRNENPALYDRLMYENDAQYLEYMTDPARAENGSRVNCDVTILPVVFHVFHDGGASNIPVANIQSQVQITNEHLRRMPGTEGYGDGVDTRVEIALATIDPQGNATSGVTYHNNATLAGHDQGTGGEYYTLTNTVHGPTT